MMRARRFFALVVLAAIAATPALHHHTLTSSLDGDSLNPLQTVCAVCLQAVELAPESVSEPPASDVSQIEPIRKRVVSTDLPEHLSARAPPAVV